MYYVMCCARHNEESTLLHGAVDTQSPVRDVTTALHTFMLMLFTRGTRIYMFTSVRDVVPTTPTRSSRMDLVSKTYGLFDTRCHYSQHAYDKIKCSQKSINHYVLYRYNPTIPVTYSATGCPRQYCSKLGVRSYYVVLRKRSTIYCDQPGRAQGVALRCLASCH